MGGRGITIASSYLMKLSLIVCAPSAFCRSCRGGAPAALGRGGTFQRGAASRPDAAAGRRRRCRVTRGAAAKAARPRGAAMLDPDPDRGLSLTIARVVQRLQGSSLHSQLERQARVSPDLPPSPRARLPSAPPLRAALFAAAAPGPCGLLVGRGSRASPVPSLLSPCPAPLPPRRGRRAVCVDSRAVFSVFPLGTQGFRSGYEDYPSEISLL